MFRQTAFFGLHYVMPFVSKILSCFTKALQYVLHPHETAAPCWFEQEASL